ncbi:MAG: RimK-like ATPgrasp N-terminal domain-containing protein, partial [Gammaproteobacteria bacterium]
MSTHLIVVENKNDWKPDFPDYPVLTAREYLSRPDLVAEKGLKVINLCRNYGYLNTGYYCSLLAEARRHRVVPTVRILSELSRKSLYTLEAGDLDDAVEKRLHKTAENSFELLLFFGECDDERLQEIGRQIFELFPCPILRVEFKRETRWRVNRIRPGYINQLQSDQYRQFVHGLESHLSKRWRSPRSKEPARYDIAMLHNPKDPLPPSNRKALQNFV